MREILVDPSFHPILDAAVQKKEDLLMDDDFWWRGNASSETNRHNIFQRGAVIEDLFNANNFWRVACIVM